jgi:hypothetical protein
MLIYMESDQIAGGFYRKSGDRSTYLSDEKNIAG